MPRRTLSSRISTIVIRMSSADDDRLVSSAAENQHIVRLLQIPQNTFPCVVRCFVPMSPSPPCLQDLCQQGTMLQHAGIVAVTIAVVVWQTDDDCDCWSIVPTAIASGPGPSDCPALPAGAVLLRVPGGFHPGHSAAGPVQSARTRRRRRTLHGFAGSARPGAVTVWRWSSPLVVDGSQTTCKGARPTCAGAVLLAQPGAADLQQQFLGGLAAAADPPTSSAWCSRNTST